VNSSFTFFVVYNREDMSTYPLIDVFKLIASFLVLIIHFRPFGQMNGNLDFASAQIISRVAVPFFLITAGYFIAQRFNGSKLKEELI